MILRRVVTGAVAIMLGACSSIDQFDVPLSTKGVVPGTLSMLSGGFASIPAGTSVSQKIQNAGVTANDITSARLTTGSITVTAPADGHLLYVESLELFVSAPGLEEKRVAHQDTAFAEKKTTYELLIDDVELKPYVAAPEMTLRPDLKLKSRPSMDLELRLDLNLHVDLSIID